MYKEIRFILVRITLKKREQIESELRGIIKGSKKNIFVKLSLTELINSSRRMYVIYDNFKSGEKFKINNNDENLQLLTDIVSDFKNLNLKIKKIPKPIKSGKINNVDPIPIAIIHAAMIIWVEVLKNKYNLKNEKLLSKNLFNYLKNVFKAFDYEADIKKSYYNWHVLKNMS